MPFYFINFFLLIHLKLIIYLFFKDDSDRCALSLVFDSDKPFESESNNSLFSEAVTNTIFIIFIFAISAKIP